MQVHVPSDVLRLSASTEGSGEVADGEISAHNFTLLRCTSRRK